MSKPIVLEEKPISMFELKEELKKNQKKEEELNFRANKTMEYLQEFTTLKKSDYEQIKEKIIALNIPRLKEEHIIKIMDTLPVTVEEAKVVLSNFAVSITNDNMKKIVDVVNSVA